MNSDFYNCGLAANTDKIYHHGYHRFYPQFINRNIDKLCEIGIEDGNSLKMWLDYCPRATIYGLDIKKEIFRDRVSIYRGDQSKVEDLLYLKKNIGNDVDVILDDGSHIPEHQILSFETLFSSLKPGGVYIIEDIETSYWKRNGLYGYETRYGVFNNNNLINTFKNILHLVNREFMSPDDTNLIKQVVNVSVDTIDSISTITFGQNCIVIKKKDIYEYQYANRTYRFGENV